MLEARHCFGACVFRDKLYVFGGLSSVKDQSYNVARCVECFDGQEWTRCEVMPEERTNIAAAALGDAIYLFGDKQPALKWLVAQNEWAKLPKMVYSIDCQAVSI